MSRYNRKGFTTIKANGPDGNLKEFAVPKNGKLAKVAEHHNRQMDKMRRQNIREYKIRLKQEKKKVPIALRSKIKLEDL